jgi:hypothetical protein
MPDPLRPLRRLLGSGLIWSTALFAQAAGWRPGDELGEPLLLLDPRRRRDGVHTLADPFLFTAPDALYLFLEAQRRGKPGVIEAYRLSDLDTLEPLGTVLDATHHLSYPFVFEESGNRYMVPETSEAGEVALYLFEDFPLRLRRVRTLLAGAFADSALLKAGDSWYLFATSERGLELFAADDLLHGRFAPHPLSPLTDDPRLRRCGGAPFERGESFYRFAQDCSRRYGGNLALLEIEAISPTDYRERIVEPALFDGRWPWNRLGGHHMSFAPFAGRTIVAVDGLGQESPFGRVRRLLGQSPSISRR